MSMLLYISKENQDPRTYLLKSLSVLYIIYMLTTCCRFVGIMHGEECHVSSVCISVSFIDHELIAFCCLIKLKSFFFIACIFKQLINRNLVINN